MWGKNGCNGGGKSAVVRPSQRTTLRNPPAGIHINVPVCFFCEYGRVRRRTAPCPKQALQGGTLKPVFGCAPSFCCAPSFFSLGAEKGDIKPEECFVQTWGVAQREGTGGGGCVKPRNFHSHSCTSFSPRLASYSARVFFSPAPLAFTLFSLFLPKLLLPRRFSAHTLNNHMRAEGSHGEAHVRPDGHLRYQQQ